MTRSIRSSSRSDVSLVKNVCDAQSPEANAHPLQNTFRLSTNQIALTTSFPSPSPDKTTFRESSFPPNLGHAMIIALFLQIQKQNLPHRGPRTMIVRTSTIFFVKRNLPSNFFRISSPSCTKNICILFYDDLHVLSGRRGIFRPE